MSNLLTAFVFTLVAGLSTGIGSVIAFFSKKTNTKFLSYTLGLSAGVMIFISLVELYPDAQNALSLIYSPRIASVITAVSFFCGMLLIALIDRFLPEEKNPHETKSVEDIKENVTDKNHLMRMGIFTALAIAVHNFPEGIATFVSATQSPLLALPVVLAIAIHNIPEGIAVSVPVYYATGSRKKAFIYSFVSGLSEPLGAIVAYLILMPFYSETLNSIMFSAVAGIMVYISVDELLPSAREYGHHHLSIYGLITGMIIMAISFIIFA